MKRINTLILLLIISTVEILAQSIVGKWYGLEQKPVVISAFTFGHTQGVYEFKSDSTFTYKQRYTYGKRGKDLQIGDESYSGTYSIRGKKVILSPNLASYKKNVFDGSKEWNNDSNQQDERGRNYLEYDLNTDGQVFNIAMLTDRYLILEQSRYYYPHHWTETAIFSKKSHSDTKPPYKKDE
jgi:hypothetical protein